MLTEIEQSIIQTLCYADVQHRPLTMQEITHRLWCGKKQWTDQDIEIAVQSLIKKKKVQTSQGNYVLYGKIQHMLQKKIHEQYQEKKLIIAKKAIKYIASIPFVRGVYICNTLASKTAKQESDIDVFIVIKNKRLYFSRLCVTLIVSMLNRRRTKKQIADTICLSFYVTESHLGLAPVAIEQPDIYLIHWIYDLIPIYDPHQRIESIHKANQWIYEYIRMKQWYHTATAYRVQLPTYIEKIKKCNEYCLQHRIGNVCEQWAKKIQRAHMKKNTQSVQNKGDTRVIISDGMLKFHEQDRRAWYKKEWEQRCRIWLAS